MGIARLVAHAADEYILCMYPNYLGFLVNKIEGS